MPEVVVTGVDQLEHLAKRLKEMGGKELRKELLRGLRTAGKPVIRSIRESAGENLPQSGGLASLTAGSRFALRNRLGGSNVSVRIEGSNRSIRGLRAMDAGTVRHPVFGNRDAWVGQSVTPGWFSKPIEHDLPVIREEMQHVLNDVAAKIERSV